MALFRAMAYEIQPFRIKPCCQRVRIFVCEEEGLRKISSSFLDHARRIFFLLSSLFAILYQWLRRTDVRSIRSFLHTNKSPIGKSAAILIGLRLYHRVLLYVHELLHAGPILVILTLLALLYTVGLGDNTGAASGVPSAYSVFNRGMMRILGTVDAEELARQYAGGMAMAGAAAGGGMNAGANRGMMDDNFEDGVWVNEDDSEEEQEEEERNLVNERRRQRRLERLQHRRNNEDRNDATATGNVAQRPPEEEHDDGDNIARDPNENIGADGDDDAADDDRNDGEDDKGDPHARTNGNGSAATAAAKKSGKKARRRNLELRREMQRQRQAAAAMGFGGGQGEGADGDARELEARMALG